ncbi:hypothetical protein [Cupriavidus sp. SK-4]|uniref:hypothetical protein n=1 Tax=Cupriavidus sp. SK-4 TaxID=574750 RepID=UPI0012690B1B|nr:hypothetical protein [Cupriavidus sp. SK-4]
MTSQRAYDWHLSVQTRMIDPHYFHASSNPSGVRGAVRADKGWKWPNIYWWTRAFAFAGEWPGILSWCIELVGRKPSTPPIGMLTVAPTFEANIHGEISDRSFAWYLSAAPAQLYGELGMQGARDVTKVLVDIAIQTRLDMARDAAILLHADPKGGAKLHEFYSSLGMQVLDDNGGARLSPLRPFKPGEYYVMDDAQSREFCSKFAQQR